MQAAGDHRRAATSARLATVIVLNYNGEGVLARCLDSLLAQTYPNFEILVVDNDSSDGSLAVLERYAARGVRVIRSETNSGVPGGRNLGLAHARGDIVAFIDNDGYADHNWLSGAIGVLESEEAIGAVSSVVFFDERKIVLNACGGTINWQGYGGDYCYHDPYEFADIPREVLFPMGCGIVVRKSALARMRRFDALPVKWYEDVELGIWLWTCGYKVVVAPQAWIDHGWGFSDAFLPNKNYMCERARIRTVLKYYPARRLPSWSRREIHHFRSVPMSIRSQMLRAWRWNLHHLPSALRWRFRSRGNRGAFWHLVYPSWGHFPPLRAENGALRPKPELWGCEFNVDGAAEVPQLNFGWHLLEQSLNGRRFCWTEAHASAFFRLSHCATTCRVGFFADSSGPKAEIAVREAGTLNPLTRLQLVAQGGWQDTAFPCELAPGIYEVVIEALELKQEESGRQIGLAVSSIQFV